MVGVEGLLVVVMLSATEVYAWHVFSELASELPMIFGLSLSRRAMVPTPTTVLIPGYPVC